MNYAEEESLDIIKYRNVLGCIVSLISQREVMHSSLGVKPVNVIFYMVLHYDFKFNYLSVPDFLEVPKPDCA